MFFCRGPLDNVSCKISKGLGEDFFGCHGNQCSKWNWILWTTLKELHATNIHTKFYQIWFSGLGDVIFMKSWRRTSHDVGRRAITIADHEHVVLRWAKNKSVSNGYWFSYQNSGEKSIPREQQNQKSYHYLNKYLQWLNKKTF